MVRHSRWLGLALTLQCCGSSCGERDPEPIPPYSGPEVAYVKAPEGALKVRVRLSKPSLLVDCGGPSFTAVVDDALFEPWRELTFGPKPVALYRAGDRPPPSEQRCALLQLELPDGPVVVKINPGHQEFTLDRSAGKLQLHGANALVMPKADTPICRPQRLLASSESSLSGAAIVQAVEAPNAEGCQKLKLRPATGDATGVFEWSACLGDAKLPFAAGDALRFTHNENPTNHVRVSRIERTSGTRLVLWILRGAPNAFATAGWDPKLAAFGSAQRAEECRPEVRAECASVTFADDLSVNFSQRSLILKSGESAKLIAPNGTELAIDVVHSVLRPVVDPACSKDASATASDVGLVVIERGGPSKAPQIAAPQ